MARREKRVCPVESAGSLDNRFRRWLQNPKKILSPFVKQGMTVLDLGCGPGFFSTELAEIVGRTGRVIASDLQEGMLRKLEEKIHETDHEEQIIVHKCEPNKIGWPEQVDFVLAFYVIHEIPDQKMIFKELASILAPTGQVLVVEPPFHVSKSDFQQSIRSAQEVGFKTLEGPRIFFNKTVILEMC